MTTFNSPLGKKTTTSSQQMREFVVPDESELTEHSVNPVYNRQRAQQPQFDQNQIDQFTNTLPDEQTAYQLEQDVKAARQAKQGKERLSEGARKRIEMLIGMTRTTRTVEVGQTTFTLQSLKSSEMRASILAASKFDGTVQSPYEIRKQFLAHSIVDVGGIEISQFISSNDFEAKLIFIEELDDLLSNRLYDEYIALTKEGKEKYALNTPEAVQEVVADLKK